MRGSGEKPGWRSGRLYRTVHRNGEVVYFKARATVLATGGAGLFISPPPTPTLTLATVSAWLPCRRTGTGYGNVAVPPDRYCGAGVLVTEGCRGEGGYLLNNMANALWSVMRRTPKTWRAVRGGAFHHDRNP